MHRLTRAIVAYHLRPSNPVARAASLGWGGAVAFAGYLLASRGLGESSWAPRLVVGLLALLGAVTASAVPCSESPFELRLPFSRARIFRTHWWIGFGGWLAGLLAGIALVLIFGGSSGELPHAVVSAVGALIVPSLFGYGSWRISRPTVGTALLVTLGVFGSAICMALPIVGPEEALFLALVAVTISVLLYGLGHRAATTCEPGIVEPAVRYLPAGREVAPSRFPSVFPDLWLALWSAAWVSFSLAVFLATSVAGWHWWSTAHGAMVVAVLAFAVPGMLLLVALRFLRQWLPLAPVALNRHRIARRCLAIFGASVGCIALLGALVTVLGSPEDTDGALRLWSMLATAGAAVVLFLLRIAIPGRWTSRLLSRWSPRWPISRVLVFAWFLFMLLRSVAGMMSGDENDASRGAIPDPGLDFVGLAREHGWTVSALLLVAITGLILGILGNIRYATPPRDASGKNGWEAMFDWTGRGS